MFSLNRISLIGYQTQPVQLRQTPTGTSVTDLNLVVPYMFKSDKGEMLTGKSFHVVTLWGPMAEVASQFVRAGSQVFIGGRLQTDSWEDESTKEKRSKTKVVAQDLIMLDPKAGQMETPSNAKSILNACNRADVIGNVTRDPEMRTTTSGQKVVTIGVATNDRWKDKNSGEMKERSEFHNVVVWGDLAEEVASSVRKGNRVFVSGRVQTRSWETQSGAKRYTTEIVGESLSLLGVKSSIAAESIDMSGSPRPQRSAPAERSNDSQESHEPALVGVPDLNYESEIKVEDLPF